MHAAKLKILNRYILSSSPDESAITRHLISTLQQKNNPQNAVLGEQMEAAV